MTNEQMAHTVARLIDFAIEPADQRDGDGNLGREWAALASDETVTRDDFAFMFATAINVTAGMVTVILGEVAPLLVVDVSARTIYASPNAPNAPNAPHAVNSVINLTTTLIDGTPGPQTIVQCASRP